MTDMRVPIADQAWRLCDADESNIDELMGWFRSADQAMIWGGPGFRFPFTPATFRQDCHWPAMRSFAMLDPAGNFCGFGQVYERIQRMNLARLVVHPERRGEGVGKRLVTMIMHVAPSLLPLDEFSLFVFRDNLPALECYRAMGFSIQDYPENQPMADTCFYMTRPVNR
ncbi:MAG TPA: GNAT family N-acetyltransferase [Woeseiaceae bacterium]|nr:GNAT family N-acetyltransferase [Woeseiaceae bacterium]